MQQTAHALLLICACAFAHAILDASPKLQKYFLFQIWWIYMNYRQMIDANLFSYPDHTIKRKKSKRKKYFPHSYLFFYQYRFKGHTHKHTHTIEELNYLFHEMSKKVLMFQNALTRLSDNLRTFSLTWKN